MSPGANYAKENIEPTLDRGFLDATSLAEYLVTKGMPFRTAHQVVGTLVAKCEERKLGSLKQLKLEDFQAVVADKGGRTEQVGADVYECLGAANVARRYKTAGAGGGEPLAQAMEAWHSKLLKEVAGAGSRVVACSRQEARGCREVQRSSRLCVGKA